MEVIGKFYREFQLFKNPKVTAMWLKSFKILQNIEHHHAMQHDTPKDQTLLLKIPTTNLIQKENQQLQYNHLMKFLTLCKWIGEWFLGYCFCY
jgi:hypothetical protein